MAGSTVGAAHRVVVAANARAQGLPQAFVAAFPEQVGVHVADGGQVTVRVVLHDGLAALVGGAYTVVGTAQPSAVFSAAMTATKTPLNSCRASAVPFWVYMVTLLASGLSTRMVTVPAWSPEPR